jgi:hypothetical protein
MKHILLSIAVMAAALVGGGAARADVPPGLVILEQGAHSDVADEAYKDVHNDADLKALWAQVYGKSASPPSIPQIDWTKQMVLAYFMGEQKHTGYRIAFTEAQEDLGVFKAQVTVTIPGMNCHANPDKVRPYIIVAVPISAAPISFDDPLQKNGPPCGG